MGSHIVFVISHGRLFLFDLMLNCQLFTIERVELQEDPQARTPPSSKQKQSMVSQKGCVAALASVSRGQAR